MPNGLESVSASSERTPVSTLASRGTATVNGCAVFRRATDHSVLPESPARMESALFKLNSRNGSSHTGGIGWQSSNTFAIR